MEMAETASLHVQTLHPHLTHNLPRTMSKLFALLAILAGVASAAPDSLYEDQAELMESEARFLYFNSSSTATSLTLLGALILLGVIFYLVYVGGLLAPVGGSSQYSRYGQDYSSGGYGYQNQARYDMSLSFCPSLRMSQYLTPACKPTMQRNPTCKPQSIPNLNQPDISQQPCYSSSSAFSLPPSPIHNPTSGPLRPQVSGL